jgi:hypothetical protein
MLLLYINLGCSDDIGATSPKPIEKGWDIILPSFDVLNLTFRGAHFKLSANQGSVVINPAHHCAAVQSRAPAIIQAGHGFRSPAINPDIFSGYASVTDQHDFQLATGGFASGASNLWIDQILYLNAHERALGKIRTAIVSHLMNPDFELGCCRDFKLHATGDGLPFRAAGQ